jgi:hypothetical protein
MVAKALQFPWRRTSCTISTSLDVIWGMSDQPAGPQDVGIRPGQAVHSAASGDFQEDSAKDSVGQLERQWICEEAESEHGFTE